MGKFLVHCNEKVNGSPHKFALLWAWSDSRAVCRLLRTGQASAPAVKTVVPETTSLPRRWRDAYFFSLPPLLYRLLPISILLPSPSLDFFFFFFLHIVYTVVCSLLLFLLSYIVNMYNCLFFILWIILLFFFFFLTTTLGSPSFYLPFGDN